MCLWGLYSKNALSFFNIQLCNVPLYKLIWLSYTYMTPRKYVVIQCKKVLYDILDAKGRIQIQDKYILDSLPVLIKCQSCKLLGHLKRAFRGLDIPQAILQLTRGCRDCAFAKYREERSEDYEKWASLCDGIWETCPTYRKYAKAKLMMYDGYPKRE